MLYLWLKAFHIIAVFCWFAALMYLPRLFVHHAATEDQIGKDRFVMMERKLFKGIAMPSMIASGVFGLCMIAYAPNLLSQPWLQLKLLLVACIAAYQYLCWRYLKAFAQGKNTKSHVYFRFFNEAPIIALIGIVLLVVLKPF